jgi:hypothetical protein
LALVEIGKGPGYSHIMYTPGATNKITNTFPSTFTHIVTTLNNPDNNSDKISTHIRSENIIIIIKI